MKELGRVALAVMFAMYVSCMAGGCACQENQKDGYVIVKAEVEMNFSSLSGEKINPLHGINNGPKSGYRMKRFWYDGTKYFKQAGIPYVRTHDVEYPYGQDLFIDIHCIFPNFDADPSLPDSYHFEESDRYIQSVIESGSQVFFRLGESIDHSGDNLYINPPRDYKKWAQICEGIINHYNNGFADGYNYGIDYWEIWNEPEGGANWTGTPEQYYELYKTAAVYLKEKFPDIKIGGYGAQVGSSPEFLEGFLKYITQEVRVPLDFFSWHVYAADPGRLSASCETVRNCLESYGYEESELILGEWNYNADVWDMEQIKEEYKNVIATPRGASYLAAALITMQNSGVDMAMYYDAQFLDIWNGLYTKTGFLWFLRSLPGLNAFSYFNEIYKTGKQVELRSESMPDCLYLCGASDGGRRLVMAANYGKNRTEAVELTFRVTDGYFSSVSIHQTDEENLQGEEYRIEGMSSQLTWTLPPDSTALFSFE